MIVNLKRGSILYLKVPSIYFFYHYPRIDKHLKFSKSRKAIIRPGVLIKIRIIKKICEGLYKIRICGASTFKKNKIITKSWLTFISEYSLLSILEQARIAKLASFF